MSEFVPGFWYILNDDVFNTLKIWKSWHFDNPGIFGKFHFENFKILKILKIREFWKVCIFHNFEISRMSGFSPNLEKSRKILTLSEFWKKTEKSWQSPNFEKNEKSWQSPNFEKKRKILTIREFWKSFNNDHP